MRALAFVLARAHFSIVLEAISVVQVLTLCLALLAMRNGRRTVKKVDSLRYEVENLNRSAQKQRFKETAAPVRCARQEVDGDVVSKQEPRMKAAPTSSVGRMIMTAFDETKAEIAKTPASGHAALLKRIFNESTIVLGVIEASDPSNPTLYVIKHDKQRRPLTFKAVPCRDLNEAELMKRVFGGGASEQATGQVTTPFASPAPEVNTGVARSQSSRHLEDGLAASAGIGASKDLRYLQRDSPLPESGRQWPFPGPSGSASDRR